MTALERIEAALREHGSTKRGGAWNCPAHDDSTPSLSLRNGDGRVRLKCFAGCPDTDVLSVLGLEISDLFDNPKEKISREIVATYDYTDESGVLLYQTVRYNPKSFNQRRPDGAGSWTWKLDGVRLVPYRLPELLRALNAGDTVYITEGEKDADAIHDAGGVATCNPMGAEKWRDEYSEHFRGTTSRVYIVADRDEPGRKHALRVRDSLLNVGVTAQIVEAREGKDASDHLRAGHGLEDFVEYVEQQDKDADETAHQEIEDEDDSQEEDEKTSGGRKRLSDLGNAERFLAQHGDAVRHCAPWRTWYVWDGTRWRKSERGDVEKLAHATVRRIYDEASRAPKRSRRKIAEHALRSESRSRIEAMLVLARSLGDAPVLPVEFDADPWAFCVRNGVVNLKTGELRPHRRAELITRLAPVDFDPHAVCELWDVFLETVLPDPELRDYFARCVGYSLTGSTAEEVVFFAYGDTASGKSTALEALKATLGEYAQTTDFSTFLRRREPGGPQPGLARLPGVRLVLAQEVERGRELAIATLKTVVSGDTVATRDVYASVFEFRPIGKIWFSANDRPRAPDDDAATWRRMRVIPFEVQIPEEDRDPAVKAELRDVERSGPGILAWAVSGCLDWQRRGLDPPDAVRRATTAYRDAMDPLADFLEERCTLAPGLWVSSADLFGAYTAWASTNGRRPLSQKAIGDRLTKRGLVNGKFQEKRVWHGVGLSLRDASDGSDGRI